MARDDFRGDVYDPGEVYTGPSKDAQGHSSNIRCHIPDPWVAAVAELVASTDWPEYRTSQDFYRDAIYHRMRWAARQENRRGSDRVRTLMALISGEAALSYATLLRETASTFVDNARRTLSLLLTDGSTDNARETIKELEAQLDHLPEPYRTQLATDLAAWQRRVDHG